MSFVGGKVDQDRLEQILSNMSTNIQELHNSLNGFLAVLTEYADADVEQLWLDKNAADPSAPVAGETTQAQAFRAEVRTLQSAFSNYASNYKGNGTLQNNAFEIAKRANPRV